MTSKKVHLFLFASQMSIFLLVSGCANTTGFHNELADCRLNTSESCSVKSDGGDVFWNLARVKEGEEYVVVFHSHADPADLQDFKHTLSLTTDRPSARIPRDEDYDIKEVQSRITRRNLSLDDIDTIIQTPHSNPLPSSQNTGLNEFEFFIPNPFDSFSKSDETEIPFFVQSPSAQRMSGRRAVFNRFKKKNGLFDLYYETEVVSKPNKAELKILSECLTSELPATFDYLGRPIDLDNKEELNLLITQFRGLLSQQTLGLFHSIDRFERNGDEYLTESNFGETIYLSSKPKPERICSTVIHELQHMINFDNKVLLKIPEEHRSDLKEKQKRRLSPEKLGLDEAYSHIVEELTGQPQVVSLHLYNFLTQPTGASFSLETAFNSVGANSRSRGLNTLFLYYVIKKAGGTLNKDDQVTTNLLRDLIQSEKAGFENIADYLGIKKDELMADFFLKFAKALFHPSAVYDFIPKIEESKNSVSRGLGFMARSSPIQEIRFKPPYVHPYEVPLSRLTASMNINLPADSVAFFRYIAPKENPHNAQLIISTNRAAPFSAYFIRVR